MFPSHDQVGLSHMDMIYYTHIKYFYGTTIQEGDLKNIGMTIMIGVVEMMVHMLEIENYLVWTEKCMTLSFLVNMV